MQAGGRDRLLYREAHGVNKNSHIDGKINSKIFLSFSWAYLVILPFMLPAALCVGPCVRVALRYLQETFLRNTVFPISVLIF